MEVLEENIVIKWPVILNKNSKQFRNLAKGLVKAKREVDTLIQKELKLEPFKGIVPVWIYLNPSEQKHYTAGSTIGSCIIILFIKEIITSAYSNIIKISPFEARNIIDTFKHEYIHYYENVKLGYEGEKYIPKDFSEGIATALINSHLLKGYSYVELHMNETYSLQTEIVENPEEYRRYHLQMKYLRVKYGKDNFNNFVKEVLEGRNIDEASVKYFMAKWQELFPSNIDIKYVQAGIKKESFKSFILFLISFIFIIISYYFLFPLIKYIITKKEERSKHLFKLWDIIENIKQDMKKKFYLNWKIILITGFFLLLFIYFQYKRDFCNTLNIDGADTLANISMILLGANIFIAFLIFLWHISIQYISIKRLNPEIIASRCDEKERVFTHLKSAIKRIENFKNKDFLFNYLVKNNTIEKFKIEEENYEKLYIEYFINVLKDKIANNKYEEVLEFLKKEKNYLQNLEENNRKFVDDKLNNVISELLEKTKEIFSKNKNDAIKIGDFIILLSRELGYFEYFIDEIVNIFYEYFNNLSKKAYKREITKEDFKTACKIIYLRGILDVLNPCLDTDDIDYLSKRLKYFNDLKDIFELKNVYSIEYIINRNIENIIKKLPFNIRIIFE
ncbi:MAG: hypothetical protein ABIM62_06730 [candidate division WOR-3 bacterium]